MQKIPVVLSIILTIFVLVFAFQNPEPAALHLFGAGFSLSLGISLTACYVLGALATFSLWSIKARKESVSRVTEEKWQKQDQKLEEEIKSDYVKQLEAKIETLDTALKAALARKKS